jgi:hypothetical protein
MQEKRTKREDAPVIYQAVAQILTKQHTAQLLVVVNRIRMHQNVPEEQRMHQ